MKPAIQWGGRLCNNAKTLRASAMGPPTLKLITAFKKKCVWVEWEEGGWWSEQRV